MLSVDSCRVQGDSNFEWPLVGNEGSTICLWADTLLLGQASDLFYRSCSFCLAVPFASEYGYMMPTNKQNEIDCTEAETVV